MKTNPTRLNFAVMFALMTVSAYAQDVIGVAPVSAATLLTMKAIGLGIIGFVGLRMMFGQHGISNVLMALTGGLVIGKSDTIAGLLGIA